MGVFNVRKPGHDQENLGICMCFSTVECPGHSVGHECERISPGGYPGRDGEREGLEFLVNRKCWALGIQHGWKGKAWSHPSGGEGRGHRQWGPQSRIWERFLRQKSSNWTTAHGVLSISNIISDIFLSLHFCIFLALTFYFFSQIVENIPSYFTFSLYV